MCNSIIRENSEIGGKMFSGGFFGMIWKHVVVPQSQGTAIQGTLPLNFWFKKEIKLILF